MTALSSLKSTLLLDLVLLPLEQHQLLLPATALAEVLPKWQSSALSGAPDWCEGLFEWRNRELLLINFDRWSGGQRSTPSNWLVVCNRSHGDLPFTHYGLTLTGRPRLQRLRSNQLKGVPIPPGTGISTMALVEGERYAIPDLAALEEQISQLVLARSIPIIPPSLVNGAVTPLQPHESTG